jgi:hypothetical protein
MGGARALALGVALLVFVVSVGGQSAQTDIAALLAMKAALVDPQGVLRNWVSGVGAAPCDWNGVVCTAGRVYELRLQSSGFQGPLAGTLVFADSREEFRFVDEFQD